MAGIGFELRKIFNEDSPFSGVKGTLASGFATVGPMIMFIGLFLIMQQLLKAKGINFQELQLFNAINIYGFFLSFIIANGLCLFAARKLSDNIYLKDLSQTFEEMLSIIAIYVLIISAVLFLILKDSTLSLDYLFALYFITVALGIILIEMTYLSAIKDYKFIMFGYIIIIFLTLIGSVFAMNFINIDLMKAALYSMGVGYVGLMLLFLLKLYKVFGQDESQRFRFRHMLSSLKKYYQILLIGLFLALAVYSHHLVMWFSSEGNVIGETFNVCNFYDIPGFYAYLTVIPAIVIFNVKVETSIYPKYKTFYDYVRGGGNLEDIRIAKSELIECMKQEFMFMIQVQLLVTFFAIILGIKVFPSIGLTQLSISIYSILCLGYLCYIALAHIIILLLYFDAKKQCLQLSILLLVLTTICSIGCLIIGKSYYGYGFFISSFISTLIGFAVMNKFLLKLDLNTFVNQPIYENK